MFLRASVATVLLAVSLDAAENAVWPAPAVAERYVQLAVQQNLTLQGQGLEVDAAQAQAGVARAQRQPRVDLVGRFSRATGGRIIEVPAADLFNPVFATLNELLAAQGRPATFSSIGNLGIPLLREQEQETKLRLIAPLFNAPLRHLDQSGRAGVAAATARLGAARRELRLAVLQAYYLCQALQATERILTGAVEITTEALRVSRALHAADKVTEDHVLRAEADDLAVRQQLLEATRDFATARHALNTLLNRPLESAIESAPPAEIAALVADLTVRPLPAPGVPEAREEFAALRAAAEAAGLAEAAVQARAQPSVALVVEGGIQGPSYRVNSGSDYTLASVVGEVNLWDGRQRSNEVGLARAQRRRLELQLELARAQLEAETRTAVDSLATARAALPAAERRAAAASRAFALVAAREREGLASQLAFLDARQAETAALLNLEITRLQLLTAGARVDRAFAASPLSP
jgi:outer membrane protein